MWTAIAEVVKSAMDHGVVGVVVIILIAWMIDRFSLVRDLRKTTDRLLSVVEANTAAMTKLTVLIEQLCNRI